MQTAEHQENSKYDDSGYNTFSEPLPIGKCHAFRMAALTVLSLSILCIWISVFSCLVTTSLAKSECFHLSNSQVCPGVRTAVSSRLGLFINEQVIKRELNHSQIHLINSTFQFDRRITNLVQGNATKLVQQIHGCTAKSSISIPLPLLCVWYINWSSQYCDSENVSLCSSALNTYIASIKSATSTPCLSSRPYPWQNHLKVDLANRRSCYPSPQPTIERPILQNFYSSNITNDSALADEEISKPQHSTSDASSDVTVPIVVSGITLVLVVTFCFLCIKKLQVRRSKNNTRKMAKSIDSGIALDGFYHHSMRSAADAEGGRRPRSHSVSSTIGSICFQQPNTHTAENSRTSRYFDSSIDNQSPASQFTRPLSQITTRLPNHSPYGDVLPIAPDDLPLGCIIPNLQLQKSDPLLQPPSLDTDYNKTSKSSKSATAPDSLAQGSLQQKQRQPKKYPKCNPQVTSTEGQTTQPQRQAVIPLDTSLLSRSLSQSGAKTGTGVSPSNFLRDPLLGLPPEWLREIGVDQTNLEARGISFLTPNRENSRRKSTMERSMAASDETAIMIRPSKSQPNLLADPQLNESGKSTREYDTQQSQENHPPKTSSTQKTEPQVPMSPPYQISEPIVPLSNSTDSSRIATENARLNQYSSKASPKSMIPMSPPFQMAAQDFAMIGAKTSKRQSKTLSNSHAQILGPSAVSTVTSVTPPDVNSRNPRNSMMSICSPYVLPTQDSPSHLYDSSPESASHQSENVDTISLYQYPESFESSLYEGTISIEDDEGLTL